MKTFKTIIAVLLTIFLATGMAWADTSGTGYTNPEFDWGDMSANNGGIGDIGVRGSYDLEGAEAHGNLDVMGYVGGQTTIGEVDENGFTNNSSYGFLEGSVDIGAMAGTGTLEADMDGNLQNKSEMGDTNSFQNVKVDAHPTSTEGSSITGNLRLDGYTYTSKKEGESYQTKVAGTRTSLESEGFSATADANLKAHGESLKTAAGVTSEGSFTANSNLEISNGEYAETFGETISVASQDENGAFGEVRGESYSTTGQIPSEATQTQ